MHKINKTAVVFLRRYATLFIKKTQYLLSRLRMNSLWRRTILNGLRLSGCGTQHPHRALGGTCVLLAAAPTTPPCFRRWRRSSSLHSGHVQRKKYFKFCVCRALRSAPNAIFTGGISRKNKTSQARRLGWFESCRYSLIRRPRSGARHRRCRRHCQGWRP